MNYMTLIYDYFNVLIRIEERNSLKKAEKAGEFYTQRDGWYMIKNLKTKMKDKCTTQC